MPPRSHENTKKTFTRVSSWLRVFVVACVLVPLMVAPAEAELPGGSRLARVYDLILAAQFDRVEAALREACPPAPKEACQTLDTAALWWRILVDPDNQSHDGALTSAA